MPNGIGDIHVDVIQSPITNSAPPGQVQGFYPGIAPDNDETWEAHGFYHSIATPGSSRGSTRKVPLRQSKGNNAINQISGNQYIRASSTGETNEPGIALENPSVQDAGFNKRLITNREGGEAVKRGIGRITNRSRSRRSRSLRTPRWMSIIKTSSALHFSMSSSLGIFGIGVAPIWQGLFGILCSMEGYLGVVSYNTTRVKLFILGLIFSLGMSAAVGILAVIGLPVGVINPVEVCQKENTGTASRGSNDTILFIDPNNPCAASYQMYGIVELATALLSLVLCVVVSVSYRAMKWECKELQLAKENEYEIFFYG